MCILLNEAVTDYKTAEEDIKCFKLLRKKTYDFVGFYIGEVVDIEKGQTIKCFNNNSIKKTTDMDLLKNYPCVVGEGAIHSFVDVNGCNDVIEYYNGFYSTVASVWECIIPKGAKYLKGVTFDNQESYVSSELQYIKNLYNKLT